MKFRDIDEAILDGVKEKLLEGFKFIYFSNQKEMWNRSRREL